MTVPTLFGLRSGSPRLADFSWLGVDLHSHLVAGIDDGAEDDLDTVRMVRALAARGFGELWTTPHVMVDLYPNDSATIERGVRRARLTLYEAGVDVPLSASAEYYLDEGFHEIVERGALRALPGERVLVEWSPYAPSPQLGGQLDHLRAAGYRPVIAHPERYGYWQRDFSRWRELRARGCELQVNLLSLVGEYGPGARACALELLSAGDVDFAATDSHRVGHIERLDEVLADATATRLLRRADLLNRELGQAS